MTRKRFIKLLMAHGESKRKAQTIAHLYNVSNKPYKDAYLNYCLKKSFSFGATCKKLSDALVAMGVSVRNLATAFKLFALNYNYTEVDNG